MRYKYSDLKPEQLKEIESKAIFITKEWGVGKDPVKDAPEYIETDRPPSLQIPRWAVIRAEELERSGMSMEEIFKVLEQEHKVKNGKPDYVNSTGKKTNNPEPKQEAPELTEEQILWINYLGTVCRMAGVDPKGLTIQDMMNVVMTANVNVVPFEEYCQRQAVVKQMFEESKE